MSCSLPRQVQQRPFDSFSICLAYTLEAAKTMPSAKAQLAILLQARAEQTEGQLVASHH